MLPPGTAVLVLGIISACGTCKQHGGSGGLQNLDDGLQWKFARIEVVSGQVYTGQIVGVYNEAKFMWTPTMYSTIVVFTCSNENTVLEDFNVLAGQDPAIFSLSSSNIVSITLVGCPSNLVEYQFYMRKHGHVFHSTPAEGESWILRAWDSYHTWEDGRGNYAWDLGALHPTMLSYQGLGTKNEHFGVWGKNVRLPMEGKIITAVKKEFDNIPDLKAAIDLEDNPEGGNGVKLQEKPHNLIELQVGGDSSQFMLRIIHLMQDSIPEDIKIGVTYPTGTLVGKVGNSGTTLVPHLHVVWGFTDKNKRFWALPIEWANVSHRILLGYPTGYEYGQYHHHQYAYPKSGYCVTN